jgi:hypothetical protein
VFCLLLVYPGLLPAGTLYVPEDQPTIPAAISAAADHDIILVGPGEYVISQSLDFHGKLLQLKSESGPRQTVIRMGNPSADRGSVFVFDDGETEGAILDGFTLTGGIGTFISATRHGGGILCRSGSRPTLKHLIVTENRALYGGALYCKDSSPTLIDCVLSRNHVQCGGGAYCEGASPTLIGCWIVGNRGSFASSGIHSKGGSSPLLESCWIVGNCTYMGGGLDAFGSSPRLTNCVVAGNFAQRGGACYSDNSSPVLESCTIVFNSAGEGGGILSSDSSLFSPRVVNTIIWGNLHDSITYETTGCLTSRDPHFLRDGSFDTHRFVTVEITGELCELPDFVTSPPDYRLQYDSPAIDAGYSVDAPKTDFEGNPRPCGLGIDIGAYELQASACTGAAREFLRGDADGDAMVFISDPIAILLHLYLGGEMAPCLDAADVDDSGSHDIADAIYLLHFLFLGGPPPAEPFGACGPDPTQDTLTCGSFGGCD